MQIELRQKQRTKANFSGNSLLYEQKNAFWIYKAFIQLAVGSTSPYREFS